jgi:hypothetical protein
VEARVAAGEVVEEAVEAVEDGEENYINLY